MYILNTTYAVDRERSHEFLLWLQQEFIPAVSTDDRVEGTSLTTVVPMGDMPQDGINSDSYCLQNAFEATDDLNDWLEEVYMPSLCKVSARFGESVQHFHTLLDEIPLTPPN